MARLARARLSNCFLVHEADGLTLVDTSFRGSGPAIRDVATRLGQPIRRVVLTHAHHDHAGSVDDVVEQLPDVELLVGGREAVLLAGDVRSRATEPSGRLRGPLFEQIKSPPTATLRPGDRIGSLEVIDAAGHTPGHLAFLDVRDRTLICGDAFLTIGDVFVTTELVARFPFPALTGTWHAASALATAERLCDLEPLRLASGHGRVVEQPVVQMRSALARARRRKAWG
jgi:glyoxylase-like metal-dependent hydrolase (beta-lactamase superfamily II)